MSIPTRRRRPQGGVAYVYNDHVGSTIDALRVQQMGTGRILNLMDNVTSVMVVNDGGNVGIGNTAPANKLTIGPNIGAWTGYGFSLAGTDATMMLQSTSATEYAGWNIYTNGGANAVSFQYGNASAASFGNEFAIATRQSTIPIKFFQGGVAAGNERLRIDASNNIAMLNANVGIGTSSPQSTLHVPDGKYAQLEDFNLGPPPAADCDNDSERGRQSTDATNFRFYICMGAARGWDYAVLTD